jgi:hypothetical protein
MSTRSTLVNAIGSSRFNDFMDAARSGQPFLGQRMQWPESGILVQQRCFTLDGGSGDSGIGEQ